MYLYFYVPLIPPSEIIIASKPCQNNYFYFICGYNYINKYSSEKKMPFHLLEGTAEFKVSWDRFSAGESSHVHTQ